MTSEPIIFLTNPVPYGSIRHTEKTEVDMEEVLKVEENGEYTVYTHVLESDDRRLSVSVTFKNYYKTLEDVKRFHPDLEINDDS
jgi:hypothetical protein